MKRQTIIILGVVITTFLLIINIIIGKSLLPYNLYTLITAILIALFLGICTYSILYFLHKVMTIVQELKNEIKGNIDALSNKVDSYYSTLDSEINNSIKESLRGLTSKQNELNNKVDQLKTDENNNFKKIENILNGEHGVVSQIHHVQTTIDKEEKDIKTYTKQNYDLTQAINKDLKQYDSKQQIIQNKIECLKTGFDNHNNKNESNYKSISNQLVSTHSLLSTISIETKDKLTNINSNVISSVEEIENQLATYDKKLNKVVKDQLSCTTNNIIEVIKNEIRLINAKVEIKSVDSVIANESLKTELDKIKIILASISKQNLLSPVEDNTLDHVETFTDIETNNIVSNIYENGKLCKSTMTNENGSIIYEMDFINEKIARTKNYDIEGNLTTEQIFHENGQVKTRIEHFYGEEKVTEFDNNGNIL